MATPVITPEAKAEVRQHFAGPPKYGRNKRLPMEGKDVQLDAIIGRHPSLTRKKCSYQLRAWKLDTYEFAGSVVVGATRESICERINDALSMTSGDFVRNVLEQMVDIDGTDVGGDDDDARLFRTLCVQQPVFLPILKDMAKLPDTDGCIQILSKLVEGYTADAADSFPETAKMLSDADCIFQHRRRNRMRLAIAAGEDKLPSSAADLTKRQKRSLIQFVSICLFFAWSRGSIDEDIPREVCGTGRDGNDR